VRSLNETTQSFATNAALLTAARLLPRLLQIGYVIFLARVLGPELYGRFAYGQSWYLALLPLTSFGLHLLLSKAISTNPTEAQGTLASTLGFRTSVAIGVTLLSIGGAYLYEPDPGVRTLLCVFSFALLGRAIATWTEHTFVAFESTHYALWCELCFRPLESGAGILLLLMGGKVVAIASLHALIWWLQAGAALLIIHWRLAPVGFRCSWRQMRDLLGYGWPLSLNIFCIGFLLQGPMVMSRLVAPSDPHLGQIAVPLQALTFLCILPAAVSGSALPVLARLGLSGDGQDVGFAQAMIRLGFGFGAVVGLVGLTIDKWLVANLLGTRYAMAGDLIGPTLWLMIPYACGHMLTSLALVQGHIRSVVTCSAGGVLVLVTAIPLLTMWWGSVGTIPATALALISWTGMLLVTSTGTSKITGCCIRSTSWVCIGLVAYVIATSLNDLLQLSISLLMLVCSAPLLGVVRPQEIRLMRQRYGF
jgi:O-antigen/teichoic acid export membrane protein